MPGKTMIGGTAYDATPGSVMVGGTIYTIKEGKNMVGGTAHAIRFLSDVTVTINGLGSQNTYVTVNADVYRGSAVLDVLEGTEITVNANLNVTIDGVKTSNPYTFGVKNNVTITLSPDNAAIKTG